VKLPVLTAAGGADWETGLVAALEGGQFGVVVSRRCVDVVELLAVAATGQGRAALVSGALRHLDADAVDRLVASGVVPVGVVVRGDVAAEERLRALGIADLVPDDAEPGIVVTVLLEAVRAASADSEPPGARERMFGDPTASLAVPPGGVAPEPPTAATRRGRVIAVWGPTGAPGRTTVAIGLADEIGRHGLAALLVDAEVYGASVAPALGLLDDSPGLAAACRQAAATRLDAAALAALCWQITPGLRVLTGLPVAARWPELRPAAVESVLDAARALSDCIVVDCGFSLEIDEELSFDTLAPRRNGATLAVLGAADVIIVVGAADPIGVQRLVRGLGELRELGLAVAPWVVLNRVRRGAVPGDPVAELTGALERFAGCRPTAFLPLDQAAADAALARGKTLAETSRRGPLRAALVELAGAVAGVPTAGHRRR
jgi:MinD-like ATPase involved in chromosome partitioning or flagellar assembly